MSYWWCLVHERVEGEEGCAHQQRLGPYETAQDAAEALERAQRRTEEWDEEDRKYREGGE